MMNKNILIITVLLIIIGCSEEVPTVEELVNNPELYKKAAQECEEKAPDAYVGGDLPEICKRVMEAAPRLIQKEMGKVSEAMKELSESMKDQGN